jgi:hypothetical protein
MTLKRIIVVALAAFLFLATIPGSRAVDTGPIDEVRKKQTLSDQDMQVIDEFIAQAVQELVDSRDFTEIAKTRTIILSKQSNQEQYAQQFSESANRHISAALARAKEFHEERQFKVTLNLLILIDGLQDPRLIDLALPLVDRQSKAIRYWAVRCITNPGLVEKLNTGTSNPQRVPRMLGQLSNVVDNSSPEVLAMMAEFAVSVDVPQGTDLLLKIADQRIEAYRNWTVQYELVDGVILKAVYGKIVTSTTSTTDVARRFAQLYSCLIQRYIKGRELLSETHKHYLASALVEVEDNCIGRLLGRQQSTIKRAVEAEDFEALKKEHDRLLGAEATEGALPAKFNFDYGVGPSDERTVPLPLSETPTTQ